MKVVRRRDEHAARLALQSHLGAPVVVHDDRSEPGMYDLRVERHDAPPIAVEVVMATDGQREELLKQAARLTERSYQCLTQAWSLYLRSDARVQVIEQTIEPILRELEAHGISDTDNIAADDPAELLNRLNQMGVDRACPPLTSERREPGIVSACQYRFSTIDEIQPWPNSLVTWLEEFLWHRRQADLAPKLQRSGLVDQHVYVVISHMAMHPITLHFLDSYPDLPTVTPRLPGAINGVWLADLFGGVRWSQETGWEQFGSKNYPR